jgi:3-oxoacyl-[acyl-carrier protein] reductase
MIDREVVLITGTRKGIGRFLAEHFVRKGAIVEGCSRQAPDWTLDGYTHHQVDVADERQVHRMVADIYRRHGRLDVAVNNAAIASMNHLLLTPTATISRIMTTNYLGTVFVSRESARLMQRRRYGRIVNLTSVAVPMRLPGEAAYAASKSAVETLTRVMARELGELGITCNAVGPPPVETDMIKGVRSDLIERVINQLAVKRLGTFADVANAIDFFVRPESGYVTGQVLYLGGVS